MAKADLSAQRLREILDYDPETDTWTRVHSPMRPDLVGKTADAVTDKGYRSIKIGPKRYLGHRLVWLWHTGSLPPGHIDHIDGNRLNNRIENLREASRAVNAQNQRSAHRNNKSGYAGVHLVPERGKYMAKLSLGGRRHFLGYFNTAEEAYGAYLAAKRRLHEGCTI